jgi:2-keto-4-pentenoate hydratase/2-oxohepta-3-ene-1,7-dioic acid hydratase in catechol pathway
MRAPIRRDGSERLMKLATYSSGGKMVVGLVDPDAGTLWPLAGMKGVGALDMVEVIARFGELRDRIEAGGESLKLADVALEAPIPRPPRNIFCVGKNYYEHAHEFSSSGYDSSAVHGAVPDHPIIFSKVPQSVIGPGATIDRHEAITDRGIKKPDAFDHVWGYTIINDMTARDLQGRYRQWLIGKSLDTLCPMGPWAVTAGEVDIATARVQSRVNGEPRQDAAVKDLIFDIPTLIETISAGITLIPGDIISTGTPAGVGIGFDPPRFLQAGDVVRMEITGIGVLENTIAG